MGLLRGHAINFHRLEKQRTTKKWDSILCAPQSPLPLPGTVIVHHCGMRTRDYWGCNMACFCYFFCLRPQDMPVINGQCSKYRHLCPGKLPLHLVASERQQEHYKNVQSCYVKHLMPYYHVSSQEPIPRTCTSLTIL